MLEARENPNYTGHGFSPKESTLLMPPNTSLYGQFPTSFSIHAEEDCRCGPLILR